MSKYQLDKIFYQNSYKFIQIGKILLIKIVYTDTENKKKKNTHYDKTNEKLNRKN